ncbi:MULTISPECIES: hypothetical protein [unclassified Streptomyces]|uniref:hypothetical protein n=1 Tax=unclassified Streptomyces TaxID=2593676 RepID=UPI0011B065EB|nr:MULTISPECIES: hypothetical protein [unclassified Streptomyces]
MSRRRCGLAVVVAALIACTACSGGSTDETSETARPEPLRELPELQLYGAESAAAASVLDPGEARVLATAQTGEETLVFYTQDGSCGLGLVPTARPSEVAMRLTSEVGSSEHGGPGRHPGGPYGQASSSGPDGRWSAVLCGEHAMVVEYAPTSSADDIGDLAGEVEFVTGRPGDTTVFAVADASRRDLILRSATADT